MGTCQAFYCSGICTNILIVTSCLDSTGRKFKPSADARHNFLHLLICDVLGSLSRVD
jgi:hypothetical protein